MWYFHLIHRFIISLGPLSSYSLSFQFVKVSYIPSHCIGSSSLRSAAVFTDHPFDQASKINNALSENSNSFGQWRDKSVAQETLLIMQYVFSDVSAIIRHSRSKKYIPTTQHQHLWTKTIIGNTEAHIKMINLSGLRQTMPQWWLVRLPRK